MASKQLREERRKYPREDYRFMCELALAGKSYSGIGTNVSAAGLFIQTSAPFAPGDHIHVRTYGSDGSAIEIDAIVVRRTNMSRSIAPVKGASTGVGLEVTFASEEFYHLLTDLMSQRF